jgi:hypothetical protein
MRDVEALGDALLIYQCLVTPGDHHRPFRNDNLSLRLIENACLSPALAIIAGLRSRAFHLPLPTSSATAFRQFLAAINRINTYAEITLRLGVASASFCRFAIDSLGRHDR